jgi:hypothetical protein
MLIGMRNEIRRLGGIAWNAYSDRRKSPWIRKTGPGFADPEYELAIEWLETSRR